MYYTHLTVLFIKGTSENIETYLHYHFLNININWIRDDSKLYFCHDSIISQCVTLERFILNISIKTITAGFMSRHFIKFNKYVGKEKRENIILYFVDRASCNDSW